MRIASLQLTGAAGGLSDFTETEGSDHIYISGQKLGAGLVKKTMLCACYFRDNNINNFRDNNNNIFGTIIDLE